MISLRNRKGKNGNGEYGEEYIAISFNRSGTGSIETTEQLTQIFARIGKGYGYSQVAAEFMAFNDMKLQWQRGYSWIDFRISDYLCGAPEEVIEDLAKAIFAKLSGREAKFGETFIRYLTDPQVREKNRTAYLGRTSFGTDGPCGKVRDLEDSVRRLKEKGLLDPGFECELRWKDCIYEDRGKASGCTVLMGILWVNTRLDSGDVPDYVLDYAVYIAATYLALGYRPNDMIEEERRALVERYPSKDKAEKWLRKHDMFGVGGNC